MKFGEELKVIARAGAGVNNIPLTMCTEKGIVVFNSPGANANGVKELVIAGMLLAARDIVGGMQWVQDHKEMPDIAKQVERAKKAFSGSELYGKKLGVIGLGAIGVLVANVAIHLGMEVCGYDPFISVEAAWKLSRNIQRKEAVEEIYRECDFITIHAPARAETKGMIDKDVIHLMKNNVVILNFARDLLVNEQDMVEALRARKIKCYVTDFPNPVIAGVRDAIVIPHLGASTEESEENCARMAIKEMMDFLENGNIKNSVNYPNCDLGIKGEGTRITILHRNIPNMISQFTTVLTKHKLNIANLTNKSKNGYAYTMIDIDFEMQQCIAEELKNIKEVLRVRILD